MGNFLTNFKEYSNTTVYKSPSSGGPRFPMRTYGQTGRHVEDNSRSSQLCDRAKKFPTTLRTVVRFVSKSSCNMSYCRVHTEQVAWVESILTCTAEVSGPDGHQHIVSSEDFRGLSQCPKANSGVGHDRLLSQPV